MHNHTKKTKKKDEEKREKQRESKFEFFMLFLNVGLLPNKYLYLFSLA